MNAACSPPGHQPDIPNSPHVRVVSFKADAFGTLAEDFNRDGRRDLSLISHSLNKLQFFFQNSPRTFIPGPETTQVGFHPGDLVRLAPERHLYIHFAEGANKLVAFETTPEGRLVPLSQRAEKAPRHGAVFHWPGWGLGLAVVPYGQDYLVLYKDVDPLQLQAAERFVVPLSAVSPSLRHAERLTLADVDGDGADEILLATVNTSEIGMIRFPQAGHQPKAEGVVALSGGYPSHLGAADLNDDGAPDLIVPDSMAPFQLHILLNDGHGRFETSADLDLPTQHGNVRLAVGRERDGFVYLLVCGWENLVLYQVPRRWDGRSAIPRRTIPTNGNYGFAIQNLLIDHDSDGSLDALVADGDSAWILYGPLWPHFADMGNKALVVH